MGAGDRRPSPDQADGLREAMGNRPLGIEPPEPQMPDYRKWTLWVIVGFSVGIALLWLIAMCQAGKVEATTAPRPASLRPIPPSHVEPYPVTPETRVRLIAECASAGGNLVFSIGEDGVHVWCLARPGQENPEPQRGDRT